MAKKTAKKPPNKRKRGHKQTVPAPFTPDEQTKILKAAASITPKKIIAECVGLSQKEFTAKLEATGTEFESNYRKAFGDAKIVLIEATLQKALDGDHTAMIFLLKARCGYREMDEDVMDTTEKAQAIREGLDRMNGELSKFQGPDGAFVKPVGTK